MWDVCSNNTPVANLSPGGNKFMSNNEDDEDGSTAGFRSPHENGQRIKPFSPESHYKSQIFMQSVLDLHKSKSTLDLRDGARNWSPENHHPSQPCDVFPRFPPSIVDANLHHRLTRGSGSSGLPERFHHHPGLNGGPLMPGGGVVPSKLHGDLMRSEEKNVSSSTGIGSHQVKTFRAIRCYHCRMCDQEFVNKSDMQRHAKEIHRMEDKGYKCVKCLKSFPSSQQLAQHSLVHTNVRKYPCRYCDKAFKQLSHVQQHLRIHTGERPYQCAVEGCSKSFRQLSSLQQHIKGHNIPLPKSYSIIHSAPSAANDLPKDKIRTSLARPTNLICQICEKHCANEIRYFQHIHKHHPDFWRVFSSGRPLSDFIDIDDERPSGNHGSNSRSCYSSRIERGGSMGGEDCGGGLLIGGEERGSSQSEPLLSCCVCKKLFAREAYLLRHLETNKEDEQHRASLVELRKDSASFFAAARYDSGTLVDEIKMEGDSDIVGAGSTSSGGGLNEGRSSASNGMDEVFRGSSSSHSGLNIEEGGKMRSRSNSPSNGSANNKNSSQPGLDDFLQGRNNNNNNNNNSANEPQQPGILATSSSSSSSSAASDLELFSPSSSASASATHLQTSSSQNHNSHQSQHRFYSSDQHQRFDACRGDTLPFSATPGPLYYSLSHHGQSAFFGGRRRLNEAEQLYRRRSEVMNPFSSLDFSAGTREFMGRDLMSRDLMSRDLISRDAMTPFYSPPHVDERRTTGSVSEDMFPGSMGGMFDHPAASAAAAGRLISGLR